MLCVALSNIILLYLKKEDLTWLLSYFFLIFRYPLLKQVKDSESSINYIINSHHHQLNHIFLLIYYFFILKFIQYQAAQK